MQSNYQTKTRQRGDTEDRDVPYHKGIVQENDRLRRESPGSNSIAIPNIDGWGKHVVTERQLVDDHSAIYSDPYLDAVDKRNVQDDRAEEFRSHGKEPYLVISCRDFDSNPNSPVAVRPLGKAYHGKWTRMTRKQYADWLYKQENPNAEVKCAT